MPRFTTSRVVDVSAQQAFSIAADVSSYKDFLPLLKRSVIRGGRKRVGAVEEFDADLQVAVEKIGVRESFASHVTTNSDMMTVSATSSDGPVKALHVMWEIADAPAGKAQVSITIDYTLKNLMLQMMAGGFTDYAAQKIMTAFEERGRSLYGARVS
ncbi:MAG: type II toxin-antitoxin system RatA family toxin [Alphaproteobacteria bacterium]|nr:type II toxin-antitoxin system RatA family toxin [Alphaproteobacteria bacterium]